MTDPTLPRKAWSAVASHLLYLPLHISLPPELLDGRGQSTSLHSQGTKHTNLHKAGKWGLREPLQTSPPQQFQTDSSVSTRKEGRLSFFHAFLTICSLSIFPRQFSSFQFSRSVVSDSLQPHESQHARPPYSRSSPKLMSIKSVMPSSHLILCRPLLLLPLIPPSIRVFSNESILRMRWPKYWSFSFRISPSKEHPGLISFRMDWLDLLAVQGTLKSLLQHHSSKASILQCSAFFTDNTLQLRAF